jgi:hypothetical protein
MELMKLNGLGWKLKKNEIFPETEKEVQIVVKSDYAVQNCLPHTPACRKC